MEWIYTRTKMSGEGSYELAQENRRNGHFFEHLVLACTIVLREMGGIWGARLHAYVDVHIIVHVYSPIIPPTSNSVESQSDSGPERFLSGDRRKEMLESNKNIYM